MSIRKILYGAWVGFSFGFIPLILVWLLMEALAARRGVPLPNLAAGQTFPMTVGSRHGPYHTVYVTEAFGLAYDLTLWLLGATVISCVILAAKGIVEETRGRSEKLAELKAGLDPAHMTEEERHYAGAWADLARRWRIVWMTLGSIALVWLGGGALSERIWITT